MDAVCQPLSSVLMESAFASVLMGSWMRTLKTVGKVSMLPSCQSSVGLVFVDVIIEERQSKKRRKKLKMRKEMKRMNALGWTFAECSYHF